MKKRRKEKQDFLYKQGLVKHYGKSFMYSYESVHVQYSRRTEMYSV